MRMVEALKPIALRAPTGAGASGTVRPGSAPGLWPGSVGSRWRWELSRAEQGRVADFELHFSSLLASLGRRWLAESAANNVAVLLISWHVTSD